MAKTVTINLGKYFDKFAIDVVKKVVDYAFIEIQQKSPVDTGQYASQNRKLPIRKEGDKIIWRIVNEGEYPERVEKGFRKTPVNWHLRDGSIYYNKGAQTYALALAKTKSKLSRLLKW